MLFNSFHFLCFFPVVLAVYFVIPKKGRYLWLLAASYFFYMSWDPGYALLLLFSTALTYVGSLLLSRWADRPGYKKAVIAVGLFANFGILFLFKYLDFATYTLQRILGKLGITLAEPGFHLLLPVGISFYIFQAVGYLIDVYRGEIKPERNFLRYALFVSFFPQLVAGPIERSANLLPQVKNLEHIKLWNTDRIRDGALIMLYGYVMKMVIADRAAILVNTVFDVTAYARYQGITVWVAAILFSLQIYCDFAGYTYIAIGAAKMMGIQLMNNFNTPYLSTSIKDFWDRWHISLTSWFKDYLYIPLGGSRKGKGRKYLNIMMVFTLSGLWHGASWHYVIWGALHGSMRVVGELTKKLRERLLSLLHVKVDVGSFQALRMVITFVLVTIAWVFFRAESVRQSLDIVVSMFGQWNPWVLFDNSLLGLGLDGKDWNVLLLAVLLMVVVECFQYKRISLPKVFARQNLWFQMLIFYLGIMAVVIFGVYGPEYDATQFIYFQF